VHSYPAMGGDIAEIVRSENLEKVIVVGHSMGGKAALQFANEYPELLQALVVIDIAPYAYPVHHRDIIDALKSVDLDTVKSRNEADEVLKKSINDTGTRQFLLKNLHWKNEKLDWRFNLAVIEQQIETIGEPTWPQSVNAIPVCFVRGGKSNYISIDLEAEIREKYPNAVFVTIDSGHWVHAEKPAELFTEVHAFLEKIPG
jgi:esterase